MFSWRLRFFTTKCNDNFTAFNSVNILNPESAVRYSSVAAAWSYVSGDFQSDLWTSSSVLQLNDFFVKARHMNLFRGTIVLHPDGVTKPEELAGSRRSIHWDSFMGDSVFPRYCWDAPHASRVEVLWQQNKASIRCPSFWGIQERRYAHWFIHCRFFFNRLTLLLRKILVLSPPKAAGAWTILVSISWSNEQTYVSMLPRYLKWYTIYMGTPLIMNCDIISEGAIRWIIILVLVLILRPRDVYMVPTVSSVCRTRTAHSSAHWSSKT